MTSETFASAPAKLMIVDDEADILTVMKTGLQRAGFSVDTFQRPLEALMQFRPGKYDLVLLDVKMAQMDGFTLYRRMLDIDPGVKACFMTAGSELDGESARKSWPDMPRICVAQKPIHLQELKAMLDLQLYSNSSPGGNEYLTA